MIDEERLLIVEVKSWRQGIRSFRSVGFSLRSVFVVFQDGSQCSAAQPEGYATAKVGHEEWDSPPRTPYFQSASIRFHPRFAS